MTSASLKQCDMFERKSWLHQTQNLKTFIVKRFCEFQENDIDSASVFKQVCYFLLGNDKVCQTGSLLHC